MEVAQLLPRENAMVFVVQGKPGIRVQVLSHLLHSQYVAEVLPVYLYGHLPFGLHMNYTLEYLLASSCPLLAIHQQAVPDVSV